MVIRSLGDISGRPTSDFVLLVLPCCTLLDPVSCAKAERVRAALPHLTAIKPNIYEARALTGCDAPEDCAHALLAQGVQRVFISLGAEGVMYADAEGSGIVPVLQSTDAPKTGAGDAMCAGIAMALASGKNTPQCAQEGMCCARRFLLDIDQKE